MAFTEQSKGGKKGKAGRKTKLEEIKQVIEEAKQKITNEALIELARSKVFQQINNSNSKDSARTFALPVTLKGITEKKEVIGDITVREVITVEDAQRILNEL